MITVEKVTLGIRYAVFVGVLLAYVLAYVTFTIDILDAHNAPADLDNGIVQLATGVGGLLAAVFAAKFGLQRRPAQTQPPAPGTATNGMPNADVVAITCVVVYFVVGCVMAGLSILQSAETPQEIKTPAALFVGYVVAMFTAILGLQGKSD